MSAEGSQLVEEIFPIDGTLPTPVESLKYFVEFPFVASDLVLKVIPYLLKRDGVSTSREEFEKEDWVVVVGLNELQFDAVSYTHLTLPTILLV